MSRRLLAPLFTVALALGALAAAPAAALAGDPCYHGYAIPPASTGATNMIELEPCAFSPTLTNVAPGTTVTFVNKSDFPHLITGVGAAWGDKDKEIAAGTRVAFTFDQPGIYPYSCALHRGMSGAIVVGNGSQAGTAADAVVTNDGDAGVGATPVVGLLAGAGGLGLGLLLAGLLRRIRAAAE